jgi:hypothetical protein
MDEVLIVEEGCSMGAAMPPRRAVVAAFEKLKNANVGCNHHLQPTYEAELSELG